MGFWRFSRQALGPEGALNPFALQLCLGGCRNMQQRVGFFWDLVPGGLKGRSWRGERRTKWLYWLPRAGRGSEHKRWSLSSHSIVYLVPFKQLPAQLHLFQTSHDALGKQLKLCGSHFPLCTKWEMITSCGRVCLSKRGPQRKWTWLISIFICMNINSEELNKTELLTSKSMSANPVLFKPLIKTNT